VIDRATIRQRNSDSLSWVIVTEHAIVIGAGFGGIAAALRLRKRGYRVTLIEQQDQLGGRATVHRRGGFTFDMGPTVITAKFLFDELFELFGKRREDYVKFVDLYPWYRIQFSDGSCFDYGGTVEQMLEQVGKFSASDAPGFMKYLEHSRRIFEVAFVELGDNPFHTIGSMLRHAPQMMRLGAWRSVYAMASKYFKNEKLRRVFSFQPLLIGGNPFSTTSVYSLIHYLERQWGVQYALGGTGAIVAALEKLMREAGIEIRLGEKVNRIQIKRGPTSSQRQALSSRNVSDEERTRWRTYHAHVDGVGVERLGDINADIVVCNADSPFAWTNLIEPEYRTKKSRAWLPRLKYSMGLFVLYFGTTKQYPSVQHHTILLGEKYKQLLHEMFDLRQLEMRDFSLYLHRPTATDPLMAPPGRDAWYVLCPVPNLQADIDWKTMGPRYRDLIVAHLERIALPELSKHIVEDFFITPEYFRDKLSSLHGAGFSIQPTFGQSAYFRFHNKAPGIENLFFVGAGTHPGAGIPGALSSAKVLERVLPKTRGEGQGSMGE
jgi:phytoene desaturase